MTQIVGSTVLIQITVTDPTGELADADVDLDIIDPSSNIVAVIPDNPSVGVYGYYLGLDEEGWWTAVWTATSDGLTTVKECFVCATVSQLVDPS